MAPINPYDTAMKTPHGRILKFLGFFSGKTEKAPTTERAKTEREKASQKEEG